jgi:hypothetical protein
MSDPDVCRREPDARQAALSDQWSEELRRHVASCAGCSAAASVAPWMERFAAMPDREHMLPDPSVVWLKAQLLRNTAAAERVTRPMTTLQIGAYLVVAGCWAALLTWKWDALQTLAHRLTPSRVILSTTAGASASMSMSMAFAVLALASVTVMVALHTILAEE